MRPGQSWRRSRSVRTASGLHWPLLDADLYVPGLIEGAFGSGRWMQQIGKLGGLSRIASKAKASRENGKRGGRPKERAAA